MEANWDFIWRLVVAGIFGTIIGLDREYREKEAGFRTHFLVALGSALLMIVSQYGFFDVLKQPGVSRPESCGCTGGERYRLYRCRNDYFQSPRCARSDDGGQPLGCLRNWSGDRGRNVLAGFGGDGFDIGGFGGARASLPIARNAPFGGRLLGFRSAGGCQLD